MNRKYNALILAAGRGSRMGKSTENSHKCLTVLDGKPLLEWQLSSLRNAKIEDITVVRGYRSELLQGDFNTAENERWAETNMVSTLFCAPKFELDTIVSYSDIVYSSEHVDSLMKKEGDIVITADKDWYSLWSARFENPLEDAETFITEDDVLKEIGEKNSHLHKVEAQYMGLIKFSPKGWETAHRTFNELTRQQQDKLDMTSLLSLLLNSEEIKVVFINGAWCEVDCYNDVKVYEQLLKKDNWSHDWRS